jgi:SAM-dependent methyltransferase
MDGSAALLASGAGLRPGDAVIDLACGTGLVARRAAPLVGVDGRVVGTDVNVAMLRVARSLLGQAEWIEAPADHQPFPDDSFDRVLCQQGFQFFPNPADSVAEALRVLRPGGELHATIWATPDQNPYIDRQLALLGSIDPNLEPSLRTAMPAEADTRMLEWAALAGCASATTDTIEHVVVIDDLAGFFERQTASTPWGPALAALSAADRREVVDDLCAALAPLRAGDGRHEVPFRSFRLVAVAD